MGELLSISEVSKRVGLSRPRISKLIKKYDIAKVRHGATFLVDQGAVIQLLTELKATGEVRDFKGAHVELNGGEVAPEAEDRIVSFRERAGTRKNQPSESRVAPVFAEVEERLARLEDRVESLEPKAPPPRSGVMSFLKDAFSSWGP